jgi:DNA-binding transcriptional LysR family regulator
VVDWGPVVASAALQLTQSAVTRRVHNLEDELGTPLLGLQTKPLQQTLTSTETYEFARLVWDSVVDLKSAIIHDGGPRAVFAVTF